MQAQLASWLANAAAEAFTESGSGSGAPRPNSDRRPFLVQLDPSGATTGLETPHHGHHKLPHFPAPATPLPPRPRDEQLFTRLEEGRSRFVRVVAASGVLLAVLLPLAMVLSAERGLPLGAALLGISAPKGDLQNRLAARGRRGLRRRQAAQPDPLALQLPEGRHAVRVISLRLERTRAADVEVRAGVEKHLDVNLSAERIAAPNGGALGSGESARIERGPPAGRALGAAIQTAT